MFGALSKRMVAPVLFVEGGVLSTSVVVPAPETIVVVRLFDVGKLGGAVGQKGAKMPRPDIVDP